MKQLGYLSIVLLLLGLLPAALPAGSVLAPSSAAGQDGPPHRHRAGRRRPGHGGTAGFLA